MHILSDSNYEEAVGAIRHILFMYVDMAQSWQGFGHGSGTAHLFDATKFVDADTDGQAYYVDLDLLRAGSAIAILCQFYDSWSEEGDLTGNIFLAEYQAALEAGRLAAYPDIEGVIRTALARDPMPLEDPWFEDAVVPIYRKYVLGFFARLAVSDRHEGKVDFLSNTDDRSSSKERSMHLPPHTPRQLMDALAKEHSVRRRLARRWIVVGALVTLGVTAMAVAHYVYGMPVHDQNTGELSTPENTLMLLLIIGGGGLLFFVLGLLLLRWKPD